MAETVCSLTASVSVTPAIEKPLSVSLYFYAVKFGRTCPIISNKWRTWPVKLCVGVFVCTMKFGRHYLDTHCY